MPVYALLYLMLITLGMCAGYVALFYLFQIMFSERIRPLSGKARRVVARIAFFSIITYIIALSMPDNELGNRVQHALGGGAMAFLVCFLAVRDSGLRISKFRFFIFSFLVVSALGVANELAEFFLQSATGFIFSPTTTDTWLDLLSNVIGALAAGIVLTPFITAQRSE